jgi:hypothetical protein
MQISERFNFYFKNNCRKGKRYKQRLGWVRNVICSITAAAVVREG